MKNTGHLLTKIYACSLSAAVLAASYTSVAKAAETGGADAVEAAPAARTSTESAPQQKKIKKKASYGVQSQSQCVVFILARKEAPGGSGDVFHFRDPLMQVVAKGRALSRSESNKPDLDKIEIALAKLKDKPCPTLQETRPTLGDAEVKGNPELVFLPSRFEVVTRGGYILENWKVSEKTSGAGVAAGVLVSYEFSRPNSFGLLLHGSASYEMLVFKNRAQGLAGVDSKSSVNRLLAGGGAGLAYHLGKNGNSRLQLLGLFDMSVMGDVNFKINDKSNKRNYAVTNRIAPGVSFDQKLFGGFCLGIGLNYSLLGMTIPDSTGAKVKVSGNALHADIGFGVSF